MDPQNTRKTPKTIFNDKNIAGDITIPDAKSFCGAIVINTSWCWLKNRHSDQGDRLEDSGMIQQPSEF